MQFFSAYHHSENNTYITGQFFVVFHELFIFLVDCQHLADPICCCLRLTKRTKMEEGENVKKKSPKPKPAAELPATYLQVKSPTLSSLNLSALWDIGPDLSAFHLALYNLVFPFYNDLVLPFYRDSELYWFYPICCGTTNVSMLFLELLL